MRIVNIIGGRASKSKPINEIDLEEIINKWDGKIIKGKTNYELMRLKRFNEKIQQSELRIIYRDNRVLRTRNTWFEWRCLHNLAKILNITWRYSVQKTYTSNQNKVTYNTEIDGVAVSDQKIAVEVKHVVLTPKILDFYENKAVKLHIDNLHLIGLGMVEQGMASKYPHLTVWKINIDHKPLLDYYCNMFRIPYWIRNVLGPRHFKFLLTNGKWHGNKRRIADTPKSTAESKIISEIERIKLKTKKIPIKIYYSLARCTDPIGEFKGKGWMSPPVIMAFDFDFPKHEHLIGPNNYCNICNSNDMKEYGEIIQERLLEEGYQFIQCYSGAKGFHFYLIDESTNEVKLTRDISQITNIIDRYSVFDDFRSKNDKRWDMHRILKLPGSVDASTGQKIVPVEESDNKVIFQDQLQLI